jgi:transposase
MTPQPPPDDHECGWKDFAKALAEKMAELETKMAAMERRILGPKSEKLPPMDREVRKKRPIDPAATQAKRAANAELRALRLETEDVAHKVPPEDRHCPQCDGTEFTPVGTGKESIVFDYVPGYLRRQRHVRETLACTCGGHVVTAPAPDHSVEGTRYSDGFRAFVVTSKCADSIPLYRQAKQIARLGVPISRSTLTDLFHQAAQQLAPLSKRLVELVGAAEVVMADETSLKMQKPNKRGLSGPSSPTTSSPIVSPPIAAAKRPPACWAPARARWSSTCTPATTRSPVRAGGNVPHVWLMHAGDSSKRWPTFQKRKMRWK